MRLTTVACKPDLLLPFGKALSPRLISRGKAVVAAHPRFVFRTFHFGWRQRHAAGMAHFMLPRFQIVIDGNPAIENKAFALPAALRARNLFKIAKNAALQMIDVFKAEILHQRAGFLTPDPAGAEHRQLLTP